jgi:D-tyrosyl-tRNA(Tyr) deacylase
LKALIQRVSEARVSIDGEIAGEIGSGLLVLLGLDRDDGRQHLDRMVSKLLGYRIFADDDGKMNLSVTDTSGGVLVVSQFTLSADTGRGLRPSFTTALHPDKAEPLYAQFIDLLQDRHSPVAQGRFGADMQVSSVNDGPVTFMLEVH